MTLRYRDTRLGAGGLRLPSPKAASSPTHVRRTGGFIDMTRLVWFFRPYIARAAALASILLIYGFARLPGISTNERHDLAARFSFDRLPLPEVMGVPHKLSRRVHPSLERVSGW